MSLVYLLRMCAMDIHNVLTTQMKLTAQVWQSDVAYVATAKLHIHVAVSIQLITKVYLR